MSSNKKRGNYLIPYNKYGSIMQYAPNGNPPMLRGWEENRVLHLSLRNPKTPNGYATDTYCIWEDTAAEGRFHPMFFTDLVPILSICNQRPDPGSFLNAEPYFSLGILKGKFQVRKRGQNFGLALAWDEE